MAGPALIILADQPRAGCDRLAAAAERGLADRHQTRLLDLPALGFEVAMSSAEHRAYHGDHPILDPMVAEHAALAVEAEIMVFVYPTVWWGPASPVKAWLERVLVPGVAFVLDHRNRVRPNLHRLRAIVGVTVYLQPADELDGAGDGGEKILLRALRLNVPHRLRTEWLTMAAGDPVESFAARVEARMSRL
jgi:putative NADPH-quinone reductase